MAFSDSMNPSYMVIAGVKGITDFNTAEYASLPLTAKRKISLIPSSHPGRTHPLAGVRFGRQSESGVEALLERYRRHQSVDPIPKLVGAWICLGAAICSNP
jgi:hypothetical protein